MLPGKNLNNTFWKQIEEFGQQNCCKNCFILLRLYDLVHSRTTWRSIKEAHAFQPRHLYDLIYF